MSFTSDEGLIVPAVSVATMREIDRVAIESGRPQLVQMMENAGRDLAETAVRRLGPGWRQVPIAVVAGSGGNGGGGVSAARHLANHGGDVTLYLAVDDDLNPVLAQQLKVFEETDGRFGSGTSFQAGLILDALIGYGLQGRPRVGAAALIDAMNQSPAPVISLDVPSGLDADTGDSSGSAVLADETLTLALPKVGLSASAAGEIWLGDLGIPAGVYARLGIEVPPGLFEHGYVVHLTR